MSILRELKQIADKNGGLLTADEVVAAAQDEASILHSRFEWDNTQAAHQYRLWQARKLISITVEQIKTEHGEIPFRVFVSLSSDRIADGGGYRSMVAVMRNPNQRNILLQDAVEDMERFQERYRTLTELRNVFNSMKEVAKKIKPHKKEIAHAAA